MPPSATSSHETVEVSPRRTSWRGPVLAALLILLLLSCCWISFWPVPRDDGSDSGSRDRPPATADGLTVSEVTAIAYDDVAVGRKGYGCGVTFIVTSDAQRLFDAGEFSLMVDGTPLPALTTESEDARAHISVPVTLDAGVHERVTLVYAVPLGAREATLAVQPHDAVGLDPVQIPLAISGAEAFTDAEGE